MALRVGATISGNVWTVKDAVSGTVKTYAREPTTEDLTQFKADQGYSSIKIRDIQDDGKTIIVGPVDKSGLRIGLVF
jgi:hypothetical protein